MTTQTAARFELGRILLTRGFSSEVHYDDFFRALVRHMGGDWGELSDDDREANENAVQDGGRILSRYVTRDGTVFWVITEHDRSVTTFLLPIEY